MANVVNATNSCLQSVPFLITWNSTRLFLIDNDQAREYMVCLALSTDKLWHIYGSGNPYYTMSISL